ncbi:GNAT family N-acetyltransferase [Synechococcus sp. CC9605]|uniref:GNAT family N-acetyltransferase n=1 Tax=Synechococcus sp. (strain CC9605) TaxID=110662 RepID=UPI00005D5ED7|nr:GNAT family protein [Synechococcus sp. CC9605]ABB36237.1 acetyltransferase-like [Synechococcus sp. CC9605]
MRDKATTSELIVEEGIILRGLMQWDSEELYNLVRSNYQYLAEWLPWVPSVKSQTDSSSFIRHQQEEMQKQNEITYGIFVQGRLSGCIATHTIDWGNKKTSIGYWIGEEYSGKKLMQKCSKKFIEHLFEEVRLNRIEIRCAENNIASRKIAEKLLMRREGLLKESEWIKDRYIDHIVYGLTKREYRMQGRNS